jgi:hypothetical protein
LVNIEALDSAITIQKQEVAQLALAATSKTDEVTALNKQKYQEAHQRLCQLEAAKKKGTMHNRSCQFNTSMAKWALGGGMRTRKASSRIKAPLVWCVTSSQSVIAMS